MIYLLLAIASSAMVSICMRLSEKYIKSQMGMFTANYAVCIILSLLFMGGQINIAADSSAAITVGLGLVSGVLYLLGFVFLKFNMKHNGIVLSSTFMKLGVLIPTIMAIVIFHETPTVMQLIGIALSALAIVLINFEKEDTVDSSKRGWLVLLLLLSGITDSMANIYEKIGSANGKNAYLLITFGTACLIAFFSMICQKEKLTKNEIFYGALIGIPNYFSARFLLLALGNMDAVIVYPTYSVATIVVITLVGLLVFKETISKKKACALAFIVTAICMLNI